MLKRNVLAGLTALTMLCSAVPTAIMPEAVSIAASAAESSGTYGTLTWSLDADGVLTISGSGKMPDMLVEESPWDADAVHRIVITEGVTRIGSRAFEGSYELTAAELPEGLREIGDGAFENCFGLNELNIPKSVTSIGSGAFDGTPWLTAMQKENPLVIFNGIVVIGTKCTGDLVIPDGTTEILDTAFENSRLTSVVIPGSVKRIGSHAFANCEGLASVTMAEGVTSLGSGAFSYNPALTEVQIPASLTNIGAYAFDESAWLSAQRQQNPLVTINGILIDGTACKGDVTIPDGTKEIAIGAFFRCETIQSVSIPDGTVIDSVAFSGCTSLETVTFRGNVPQIGTNVFKDTPWLAAQHEQEPLVIVSGILIDGTACTGDVVVPDTVTSVLSEAFYCCSGMTSIVFPDSVTSLSPSIFTGCDALTVITIRNPYCAIPDDLFYFAGDNPITIEGYDGSTAQTFAEKRRVAFRSLGEIPEKYQQALGDVDGSIDVNASDAAKVLIAAAAIGAGMDPGLTGAQKTAADVNSDTSINATDAAIILQYAAAVGAGQKVVQITDFVRK